MTPTLRAYLKAKAMLLALILDPRATTRDSNRIYVTELAFMDYVNACAELGL